MYARHIARRVTRARVCSSEVLVWRAAAAQSTLPHQHDSLATFHAPFGLSSQPRHTYATRSSAADSYLVEVLKSEIEHELHEEVNKKGYLKGSTGPFELVDKAGTEEVVLKRTFGNEEISVTCIVESQYPDAESDKEENESDDEPQNQAHSRPVEVLHLTVTITKDAPMPALEFECTYVRGSDEIDITSLNYLKEEKSEGEDDDEPQYYTGPDFDDLDENLQRAFHDLLKARGISPKISSYVLDYITVKEHREYMRWLHNVETFFSS